MYFAADDPAHGNRTHRMFVLEGPTSERSPLNGEEWKFYGRLEGMPENQWAIDGTVISLNGGLCFVYSGWPLGVAGDESKQELYIVEMTSPTSCTGQPTRISTPDHHWEYSGNSGINEGPQFLCSPDGRWAGIAYSCAGSWTSDYKMNVLHFTGGNPVDANSWKKWDKPLLQCSRDGSPPYGPGHGNFVMINGPGGQEVWGVFHATDAHTGWEGRKARVMRVGWGAQGPFMGKGECGGCTADVNHFLYGMPPGVGGGNHSGGGMNEMKADLKNLVGEAKDMFRKFKK